MVNVLISDSLSTHAKEIFLSRGIDVDVKPKTLADHGQNVYEVELVIKGETKVETKIFSVAVM